MEDRILTILRNHLEDDKEQIDSDSCIATDLSISSFEMIQIISEIEEAFGIEIEDSVIADFETVADIVDYVCERSR